MLKTSPALSTSANTSPTTFRYAPSAPQTSPKPSPALRRRHSARSINTSPVDAMKSSPMQRPRQYVANDLSGQGSAMETQPSSSSALPQKPPAQPPQSPRPSPMVDSSTALSQASQSQVVPPTQSSSEVSPTKRRSSPPPTADHGTAVPKSPPKTSKRARPDEPPPKVLPLRYEFCAVEDMVELIAHMLAELIATNDAIRISNGGLTRFHSRYGALPI